ncbi:F0F1 ATP synthase subunit delta [Campylobacter lari]|uniref:ATP synthase subunit delta n=4 Tax=Campylobacter lari TaxID=201 RepID=ATPD_CAMLR|nr:F0F1 ATP synthase subunit delta [Campylobacter lari]B9KES0.1 RecName: Full=ATP synthase subunit delta; AltName: Full=ATP synthase F(1) sector subunit delta; AltName: Full=F-type ATPase subunit delta; Short=F-ATPase subunit delta [Campylobacter lari RM2100]ACM63555.1 ATP synthase, F1 complex, delta subunit [Campylobacter lari RM2100]EAH4936280.1 F0F1 ATP synthase subunit delta [Campylobacter lari]EAH7837720.1 F0F1 ATP synthase subunit delta [Campylobacter lari]EAI2016426.1 F0F1 ATP synthase 
MEKVIAKTYAKAILERNDFENFYSNLLELSSAFASNKFIDILNSYEIKQDKKLELILSLLDNPSDAFKNFINLIVDNKREMLIPEITKELSEQKASKENTFLGQVYSKEKLSEEEIKNLEEKLSLKFNAKIRLDSKISDNDSVKISLDGLGYEISFSMQSLKAKMNEYILKAI